MVARIWRGRAAAATAEDYRRHFEREVAPRLRALPGHRGAWLLSRDEAGAVEFLALTLWESMAAIERFAGPDPDTAVVEPAARAALSSFDEFARHYEVAYRGD